MTGGKKRSDAQAELDEVNKYIEEREKALLELDDKIHRHRVYIKEHADTAKMIMRVADLDPKLLKKGLKRTNKRGSEDAYKVAIEQSDSIHGICATLAEKVNELKKTNPGFARLFDPDDDEAEEDLRRETNKRLGREEA